MILGETPEKFTTYLTGGCGIIIMGELTYADLLEWLGLSNWQFVLLSLVALLVWVGVRTAWEVGGVGRVRVARKLMPGFQAVFISYEGSYSSIGAVYAQAVEDFQMVFKFSPSFALYYPPERAVIGLAINKLEESKIPLFLSKFPMYRTTSFPSSDALAADCPMINSASSQLAVARVYPAIEQRLKELRIERESEVIMEIYHSEAASPFIDVIFPIQNERSFQLWYEPSDYSRVFPPKNQ
jgi:hypothetical protein